jgi:hypothetical protein
VREKKIGENFLKKVFPETPSKTFNGAAEARGRGE